ncbi:MAG: dihydrolipoyl dehydrogenase family protein [Thermoguttaceae bacterium]
MQTTQQDIVVIGGGPGGYVAAIRAAQLGMKVTLVEKDELGGTCLNRGCIPTKVWYQQAEILRSLTHLDTFQMGELFDPAVNEALKKPVSMNMQAAQKRKNQIVGSLTSGVASLLKANGVTVLRGTATVTSPNLVRVRFCNPSLHDINAANLSKTDTTDTPIISDDSGEVLLETSKILIATGSKNKPLPVPGVDLPGVMDSTGVLNLETLPKHLVIIGGGVIGLEFASIFNAFGSEVTVIETAPRILLNLDSEISKRMSAFLKRQGIDIQVATNLVKIEKATDATAKAADSTANNGVPTTSQEIALKNNELVLTLQTPKGESTKTADIVLVATGRAAELNELGFIDSASDCFTNTCTEHSKTSHEKLKLDFERGWIKVNENFETSIPGIFAIGDVIGGALLAHVASEEGRVAVERMNGIASHFSADAVPGCVFSFPQIATVGHTEETLKEQGIEYRTGKFSFSANGKAQAMGETDGFVKIIAGTNDQILGVHIIGPHASDLILEATLLVTKKMTLDDVLETIHPHPTLGEAIHEAVLDVRKSAIHVIPVRKM